MALEVIGVGKESARVAKIGLIPVIRRINASYVGFSLNGKVN
jgi:hypothetical protein